MSPALISCRLSELTTVRGLGIDAEMDEDVRAERLDQLGRRAEAAAGRQVGAERGVDDVLGPDADDDAACRRSATRPGRLARTDGGTLMRGRSRASPSRHRASMPASSA